LQADGGFAAESSVDSLASSVGGGTSSAVVELETLLQSEDGLQTTAQIFRTLQAETAVVNAAIFKNGLSFLTQVLDAAEPDVSSTVQLHGRLSGSGTSGGQHGQSDQRLFHIEFLLRLGLDATRCAWQTFITGNENARQFHQITGQKSRFTLSLRAKRVIKTTLLLARVPRVFPYSR